VGHYLLGKAIGEGTFGRVKLGTHILTDETLAVKILEKARIADVADVERVARELHILKLVQHPHVIQLYEIIETPHQLYLIMEYCSCGELFDFIVSMGAVPEPQACRFFHQITAGVERLHQLGVVHRDLKPENLLLDGNQDIKIVDFGLSNTFQKGQLLQTACGSPCYAAPEMIAGQRYAPEACDIWSCGVILFALVCGYLPFEDPSTAVLYSQILSARYELPEFASSTFCDLVGCILTTDPAKRYAVDQIRSHEWYHQIPEASRSLDEVEPQGKQFLDEDVLQQLSQLGLPRDYAEKCLQMRKHNHVTTTYYLLGDRKRRLGDFCNSIKTSLDDSKPPRDEAADARNTYHPPRLAEFPAADVSTLGGSTVDVQVAAVPTGPGASIASSAPSATSSGVRSPAPPPPALPAQYLQPTPPRPSHQQTKTPAPVPPPTSRQQVAPPASPPHPTLLQAPLNAPRGSPTSGAHVEALKAPRSPSPSPIPSPVVRHRPTSQGATHRSAEKEKETPALQPLLPSSQARRRSPATTARTERSPTSAVSSARANAATSVQAPAAATARERRRVVSSPTQPAQQPASALPQSMAGAASHGGSGSIHGPRRRSPTRPEVVRKVAPPSDRQPPWHNSSSRAESPGVPSPHVPGKSVGAILESLAAPSARRHSPPATSRVTSPQLSPRVLTGTVASARGVRVPTSASIAGGSRAPHSSRVESSRGASPSEEAPGASRGAHLVRSSLKSSDQIMQEITRALRLTRVPFKQISPSHVKCDRKGLRFDMQISHYDQAESTYVVKIQRSAGEVVPYRELCARVLAEMQI